MSDFEKAVRAVQAISGWKNYEPLCDPHEREDAEKIVHAVFEAIGKV